MEHIATAAFWVALGKIVWVNIRLSGDNAVVMALAERSLAPRQRNKAIVAGSAVVTVLRVLLTVSVVSLLRFVYLKLVGAVLVFWIGVQLVLGVMQRYPFIITLGAALLGFVAGEMLVTDQALARGFEGVGHASTTVFEVAGAIGVVVLGTWLARRKSARAGPRSRSLNMVAGPMPVIDPAVAADMPRAARA